MITGGTEVIIGVTEDHMFGPLVVFGLGGAATEVLADHAARLTPLTDTDADTLIHSVRAAPLLLGHRGSPAADLAALREVLLRVSRLADDLPEITDLDLNPVIARPGGVRGRRADQGGALPAAGPLSSQAALTGPEPGAAELSPGACRGGPAARDARAGAGGSLRAPAEQAQLRRFRDIRVGLMRKLRQHQIVMLSHSSSPEHPLSRAGTGPRQGRTSRPGGTPAPQRLGPLPGPVACRQWATSQGQLSEPAIRHRPRG